MGHQRWSQVVHLCWCLSLGSHWGHIFLLIEKGLVETHRQGTLKMFLCVFENQSKACLCILIYSFQLHRNLQPGLVLVFFFQASVPGYSLCTVLFSQTQPGQRPLRSFFQSSTVEARLLSEVLPVPPAETQLACSCPFLPSVYSVTGLIPGVKRIRGKLCCLL